MAQTIVTPVCTASPANGGSCTYSLGTSGSYSYPASSGAWQNYTYSASPAPGFRFLRFEITVTSKKTPGNPTTVTNRETSNPFETDGAESRWLDGSAWWMAITAYPQSEEWIDSISVVAVFEPRNSGQLVYSDNQGGQLVYSGSQGGALVYDGDFAGNNSGTT